MRHFLQRVKNAAVVINGEESASIGLGLLVLVGIGQEDLPEVHSAAAQSARQKILLDKLLNLRIFADSEQKMNLSLLDCRGELLIVSQFTLHADCRKGRRPSFTRAAPPAEAKAQYDSFVELAGQMLPGRVKTGSFGAEMDINLTNWGPVSIWLDSSDF